MSCQINRLGHLDGGCLSSTEKRNVADSTVEAALKSRRPRVLLAANAKVVPASVQVYRSGTILFCAGNKYWRRIREVAARLSAQTT
jgi:hypothetical protein